VGQLVPVLVTRADVDAGARLKRGQLAVRQVPSRSRRAMRWCRPIRWRGSGWRAAWRPAPTSRRSLDAGPVASATRRGADPARRAQRGRRRGRGEGLAGTPPGTRVDVLVTTESRSGAGGRTYWPAGRRAAGRPACRRRSGGQCGAREPRRDDRDAARDPARSGLLTAAQSFAREIRLLVRAPGDRRPARPLSIDASACEPVRRGPFEPLWMTKGSRSSSRRIRCSRPGQGGPRAPT